MTDDPSNTPASTTHFGFEEVPTSEKAPRVKAVFDSVAEQYDVMNDLMSFGIHRLWKRFTIELSRLRAGDRVLDVASGTGDLAKLFVDIVGDEGEVVLGDINEPMLRIGRDRLIDAGIAANTHYVLSDGQQLAFKDNSFDCVCVSFGLRNFTDKTAGLESMLRVLKPGGRLLILEFSKPEQACLASIYDWYSFNIIPKLGKWVGGDQAAYQYLAESIRKHPNQQQLQAMIEAAGFGRVEYFNMTGGIVAVHRAIKP